jgi:general secretion pathway protein C
VVIAAEQLFERVFSNRWTPVAVNMAALLLLTYNLAQWSGRAITPATPPESVSAPPVTDEKSLQSILAANLFGPMDQSAARQERLPLTSLSLVLAGIVVQNSEGLALISIDGAPEAPFRVGQEIMANTRLQAVFPDRAILQRAGVLETLLLKDTETAALPSGSILRAPRPATGGPPAGARAQEDNRSIAGREAVNRRMPSPEILNQALMVPNPGGGFLVREIQPGSFYEKAGLHVGDIIRRVNGQAVNTLDEVMRIYQQVGGTAHSGRVTIEVTRAGKVEMLQHPFEQH